MQEEHLTQYPRRLRECLIQMQNLPRYLSNGFSGDQHLVNISYLSRGSMGRPRGGIESVGLGCTYTAVEGLRAAACGQPILVYRAVFAFWRGPWQALPSPAGTWPPSSTCCLMVVSLLLLLSPEPLRKQAHSDSLLCPLVLESARCP